MDLAAFETGLALGFGFSSLTCFIGTPQQTTSNLHSHKHLPPKQQAHIHRTCIFRLSFLPKDSPSFHEQSILLVHLTSCDCTLTATVFSISGQCKTLALIAVPKLAKNVDRSLVCFLIHRLVLFRAFLGLGY